MLWEWQRSNDLVLFLKCHIRGNPIRSMSESGKHYDSHTGWATKLVQGSRDCAAELIEMLHADVAVSGNADDQGKGAGCVHGSSSVNLGNAIKLVEYICTIKLFAVPGHFRCVLDEPIEHTANGDELSAGGPGFTQVVHPGDGAGDGCWKPEDLPTVAAGDFLALGINEIGLKFILLVSEIVPRRGA